MYYFIRCLVYVTLLHSQLFGSGIVKDTLIAHPWQVSGSEAKRTQLHRRCASVTSGAAGGGVTGEQTKGGREREERGKSGREGQLSGQGVSVCADTSRAVPVKGRRESYTKPGLWQWLGAQTFSLLRTHHGRQGNDCARIIKPPFLSDVIRFPTRSAMLITGRARVEVKQPFPLSAHRRTNSALAWCPAAGIQQPWSSSRSRTTICDRTQTPRD